MNRFHPTAPAVLASVGLVAVVVTSVALVAAGRGSEGSDRPGAGDSSAPSMIAIDGPGAGASAAPSTNAVECIESPTGSVPDSGPPDSGVASLDSVVDPAAGCISLDCRLADDVTAATSEPTTATSGPATDETGPSQPSTAPTSAPSRDDLVWFDSMPATAPARSADDVLPADSLADWKTLEGCIYAVPDGSTLVATVPTAIDGFAAPLGEETGTVEPEWHGRASILPVVGQVPGWLEVRLPQRPNGSTAWVRSRDVRLATTPFQVEIDVATTRLRLYEAGEEILDAPVGLGTEDAPTTLGEFFVTFFQEPPDTTSGWGPFVIVTSSHSETISDFQSFGDAIAAIHGPLGAEDEIGEDGAYVSHGCIRLHLDDLAVLRQLPVGTPITVIDSSADVVSSSVPSMSGASSVPDDSVVGTLG